MRFFFIVLGLLFVAIPNKEAKAEAPYCSTWGCNHYIDFLYMDADGSLYIATEGDESMANCTPVEDTHFTLEASKDEFETIYATLLTAQEQNKQIHIQIKEGSAKCSVDYVQYSAED